MRPAGGKAPASAVAASSRPGLGRWRWPVLATLGLLAGGAAALQLLGPLPTEPPAAPVLALWYGRLL